MRDDQTQREDRRKERRHRAQHTPNTHRQNNESKTTSVVCGAVSKLWGGVPSGVVEEGKGVGRVSVRFGYLASFSLELFTHNAVTIVAGITFFSSQKLTSTMFPVIRSSPEIISLSQCTYWTMCHGSARTQPSVLIGLSPSSCSAPHTIS